MKHTGDVVTGILGIILILVVILFLVIWGAKGGYDMAAEEWERAAVQSGHAEWYVDDHEKKWRWRECASCVKPEATKEEGSD